MPSTPESRKRARMAALRKNEKAYQASQEQQGLIAIVYEAVTEVKILEEKIRQLHLDAVTAVTGLRDMGCSIKLIADQTDTSEATIKTILKMVPPSPSTPRLTTVTPTIDTTAPASPTIDPETGQTLAHESV